MNKYYYGYIYITTNLINGKRYVGQKKIDHNSKGYLGSGVLLRKAIKKYGKENFKKTVVCFADTFEELNEMEKSVIKTLNANNSDNFYNIEEGGWKYPLAESTKQKIRENHAHLKGKDNPCYGRKLSAETRKKISETQKGRKPPNKGKPMSEAQKQKLKEAWKTREKTVSNHRQIYCIEEDKIYYSIAELSRECNLTYGSIVNVLKKHRNSLFGKHYIYLDEREEKQYV